MVHVRRGTTFTFLVTDLLFYISAILYIYNLRHHVAISALMLYFQICLIFLPYLLVPLC